MARHGVGKPTATVPSYCSCVVVLFFLGLFFFGSQLFAGTVFHSELRNWQNLSRLIELTLGCTNNQPKPRLHKKKKKKKKNPTN